MQKGDKSSVEVGKDDARFFITNELIDYEPFIALSDMYLVRRAVPVDYAALEKGVVEKDPGLWEKIDESCSRRAAEYGEDFNRDEYALGFVEIVSAVWENIRDEVLKERW